MGARLDDFMYWVGVWLRRRVVISSITNPCGEWFDRLVSRF